MKTNQFVTGLFTVNIRYRIFCWNDENGQGESNEIILVY